MWELLRGLEDFFASFCEECLRVCLILRFAELGLDIRDFLVVVLVPVLPPGGFPEELAAWGGCHWTPGTQKVKTRRVNSSHSNMNTKFIHTD